MHHQSRHNIPAQILRAVRTVETNVKLVKTRVAKLCRIAEEIEKLWRVRTTESNAALFQTAESPGMSHK